MSPLTITLGDEFQGVLKNEFSFYEVLTWIEKNKWRSNEEIRLRYVLEYGQIETDINTEIAHGMMGEGLKIAREKLSNLKKEKALFSISQNVKQAELKQIMVHLYLSHVGDWNWRDKDLIWNFLEFTDYKTVAERLQKDTSLIWKRQYSLGLDNYQKLKRALEIVFCSR
ncbi:SatD family protein [Pleomorphovibrio marinus]|uniref:SatD family protein n=1 Tax=Pleomorphovibrio marinus TaxID=2164132 RepID=UPI00130066B6|nr:SatD family protein [Pleomorphovibrio marinus]